MSNSNEFWESQHIIEKWVKHWPKNAEELNTGRML